MDEPARDESDTVLAAALTLIEEVFGSSDSDGPSPECEKLRRRRFSRRQEETVRLRTRAAELQHRLDTLRGRWAFGNEAEMARAWAQVASGQRQQSMRALEMNATLTAAIQGQQERASTILELLTNAQEILRAIKPPLTKQIRTLPLNYGAPPELVRYLDTTRDQFITCTLGDIGGPTKNEHSLVWQVGTHRIKGRYRLTAVFPFKLSTVANEMWKVLQLSTLGETPARHDHDEHTCVFDLNVRRSDDRMEIKGFAALQRTYLPDGSVLLGSASMSTGPATGGNLMAGLELHETLWIRVGRRDATSPRSPVFMELVDDIAVMAPPSFSDSATRLQRLKEYAERTGSDGARTRQDIENRILTSSLDPGSADFFS